MLTGSPSTADSGGVAGACEVESLHLPVFDQDATREVAGPSGSEGTGVMGVSDSPRQ